MGNGSHSLLQMCLPLQQLRIDEEIRIKELRGGRIPHMSRHIDLSWRRLSRTDGLFLAAFLENQLTACKKATEAATDAATEAWVQVTHVPHKSMNTLLDD